MPAKAKNPQPLRRLRLSHEVMLEAHLRLTYAEAASRAAKDGMNDLYETYTNLADEHKERWANLKSQLDEMK